MLGEIQCDWRQQCPRTTTATGRNLERPPAVWTETSGAGSPHMGPHHLWILVLTLFIFFKNFFDTYLFLAVLYCCAWAFSGCSEWRLLSRCSSCFSLQWLLLLQSIGSRAGVSVAVVHRLSCPKACGIFPYLGLDLCPLRWQADSLPLDPQGSPFHCILTC